MQSRTDSQLLECTSLYGGNEEADPFMGVQNMSELMLTRYITAYMRLLDQVMSSKSIYAVISSTCIYAVISSKSI